MDTPRHHDGILILDYGSQFTQLIARRVREAHVYCEIHPGTRPLEWIREWRPKGVILSGGPNSVYDEGAPTAPKELLDLGVPVLGLCYGMGLIAQMAGAQVVKADRREYGRAVVTVDCMLSQRFDSWSKRVSQLFTWSCRVCFSCSHVAICCWAC